MTHPPLRPTFAAVSLLGALLATGAHPAAASHASVPFPLGSFKANGAASDDCPAGLTCSRFTVTCPGVQGSITGRLGTGRANGTPRGVVVLFSGGGGTTWWTEGGPDGQFLTDMRAEGFTMVVVRWTAAWLESAHGERAGPAHLACRPATAVKWIHDHVYAPLKVDAEPGRCGFCITGNSGGASQVAYTLSHYGLESILDAVIPTSGPPHAALVKGCLQQGVSTGWFAEASAAVIDSSYGYGRNGPCVRHDKSYTSRWRQDAPDTAGDHAYPRTRVHVIVGDRDPTSAVPHALDFVAAAQGGGSPWVVQQVVGGMRHRLQASEAGLAALAAAIQAAPGDSVPSDLPGGRGEVGQGDRSGGERDPSRRDPGARDPSRRTDPDGRRDPTFGMRNPPADGRPAGNRSRDADWWWLIAVVGLLVFGGVALPKITKRLRASPPGE